MLVECVTHRASQNHILFPLIPSPPASSRPLCRIDGPLRPIVEVSAGLDGRICSAHPPPVSVSREQAVCPARLGFLPIFPLCQTEKEGSREGESSGMLAIGEGGQQRKQEKYIFLSLLSPSEALCTSSSCVSCSPVFTSSIPPASHFVLPLPKPLILLVLPHTHSLILNLFFPLHWPFLNCSPHTSLLPTSSLFVFLSITSEHATSQHNPFTHSRMTAAHPIFSPSSLEPFFPLFSPCFFFVMSSFSQYTSAQLPFSLCCLLKC